MDRLVDGFDKVRNGEMGPSMASASKSVESLAGSTPPEALKEVTPNTSSDKHGGETKIVESPGKSPQVQDLGRLI